MKPQEAYEWLKSNSIESSYLSSMGSLIAWDQRTFIPKKGHQHRAEQLATLAKLLHERATDPKVGDCLFDVEGSQIVSEPTSPEAVNVREWRWSYDRTVKIPSKLAEDLARTNSECETLWEETRAKEDWKAFSPKLARVFELTKEKADAIGYKTEAYDALIEDFEPGETTSSIEPLLTALKKSLTDLLQKITNSKVAPKTDILKRSVPVDRQAEFGKRVVSAMGYDFEGGRLDQTAHPFTIGIGPGDVRITTRYAENYFPGALYGTIHEAGHALYEQGLPEEHWGTPMGGAVSLGIHESQSRMWENMVGRTHGFWEHFFPSAKTMFSSFDGVQLDDLVLALNSVKPSLIRVEADEVTYNLHILLRFELELKILRGDLKIDDLPYAWNCSMQDYLGVSPKLVSMGAMQDVHWPAGLIGYFPTYTLGNVYGAQLFAKADEEISDLKSLFAKGEFAPLRKWLRKKVHSKGGMLRPAELIKSATGKAPSPDYFTQYCEKKYSELYKL